MSVFGINASTSLLTRVRGVGTTVIRYDVVGSTSQTHGLSAMLLNVDDVTHGKAATLPPAGNSHTLGAIFLDGWLSRVHTTPDNTQVVWVGEIVIGLRAL